MAYYYDLFGYSVVSNAVIPGLTPTKGSVSVDFSIHFAVRPANQNEDLVRESLVFESSILTEAGRPSLRIFSDAEAGLTHILYDDGMEFWFDERRHQIWCVWPEPFTLGDAATYLLGPVFGVLLRLKGTVCLHASAVAIGGKAILFSGDAGAGKSTTAAAMAKRGHAVISDDIVPIDEHNGQFIASPAYSYLALWPESVRMLYGSDAKLPEFSQNFTKQQLTLPADGVSFKEEPVPLGGIFIFATRGADDDVPRCEDMNPQQALLALIANSYASRVLDIQKRAKEFELLGRVAKVIPVKRLFAHSDAEFLGQLCTVIETACRGL